MIQMLVKSIAVLWIVVMATVAHAQVLTPETFLQADQEAMERTVIGIEQRLAILSANGDVKTEEASGLKTQADVELIFRKYGTTPAAHGAYAAQHQEEIVALMAANSDWEARYVQLRARRDAAAAAIYGLIQSRVLSFGLGGQ
jgi:hypothetical protein